MATITHTQEPEIDLIIDDTGTVTYIGRAKLGSGTDAAVWQIRKITLDGSTSTFQYANGSRRYNQIWDNRAALTYSN